MKMHTEQEIIEEVKRLWPSEPYPERSPDNIQVTFGNGTVRLSLSSMYDPPGLSFVQLKALSEFFETDQIRDERFSSGGCETCDYGSDYGFTLTIG